MRDNTGDFANRRANHSGQGNSAHRNRRCVMGPVLLLAAALALPVEAHSVTVISDIEYVPGGGAPQSLDLYLPDGLTGVPLIVFIHGGGWVVGHKAGRMYTENGHHITGTYGFGHASLNYRLSGRGGDAIHPDHVEDCAAALKWLYDHASDYGYDRDKIFVTGHSSGGHLAALLALDNRWLDAVGLGTSIVKGAVPMSGVYDLANCWSTRQRIVLPSFGDDPQVHHDASPIHLVHGPPTPPMLIMYGEGDKACFQEEARDLARALVAAGNPDTTVIELPDHDHNGVVDYLDRPGDPGMRHLAEFVTRHAGGGHQAAQSTSP